MFDEAKGKAAAALLAVGRFTKHQALRFVGYLFDPKNFGVLLVFCAVVSSINYLLLVWAVDTIRHNAPVVIPTIVATVTNGGAASTTSTRTATNTSQPLRTPTTIPTITITPPWDLARNLYFAALPYPMRKPANEWTISADGVKFNSFWEGFYSSPYDDGGAPGVGNCTIGYGHLLHIGPCNGSESVGTDGSATSISQSRALALLEKELNHCGSYIDDYVKVPITQNQFNTMSSIICNWGYGKFSKSEIVKLTNEGDFMGAGEVWKTTATCGIGIGCGLPGLVRRRAMESYFFTSPVGTPMWPFVELR